MNYNEAVDYLCNQLPMFQKVGSKAYKEGLENTLFLDRLLGHPHTNYKTIHVGGTNGKGSVSHTLAAILQQAGYKVGLYTSPHLLDFSERIRVNGVCIKPEFVVSFVLKHQQVIEEISPSFFELTTAMAFDYFAFAKVDVAVIEVGLGGRLDCTNIISPDLSIITNISYDHTALLGNTLERIAREKAGIIKSGIPVIIGESVRETKEVFIEKSKEESALIRFADQESPIVSATRNEKGQWVYQTERYSDLVGTLRGNCQLHNSNTILTAVDQLIKEGYSIPEEAVFGGFAHVDKLTGLRGRWELISERPLVICDTGHNESGIKQIMEQIESTGYKNLRIVFGMVNDKDISSVLSLLPIDAHYYFCQASVPRSLQAEELASLANQEGLHGRCFPSVAEAFNAAQKESAPSDMIFVGGSTFVVADFLSFV